MMPSIVSDPAFDHSFLNYRQRVEEAIQKRMSLFHSSSGESALSQACAYALSNGGKRFRPVLVFLVADALHKGYDVSDAAVAIEYFHTASLIADDLPCMDDDSMRRNQPALHKVFGEATALLASYAFIAAGYGLIGTAAKRMHHREAIITEALENASFNTGIQGTTGGQFLDLNPPELTEAALREILRKKTVSLFEISFVFGWLFGGGALEALPTVKQCAAHFGLAFQIADDLGDVEQDAQNGRQINTAGMFGKEAAIEMLRAEIVSCRHTLSTLGIASKELLGLAAALDIKNTKINDTQTS